MAVCDGNSIGSHNPRKMHFSDFFLKSMQLDVTTQIYIVGGTLAGVLLLVGLMVMILALNITRLTH